MSNEESCTGPSFRSPDDANAVHRFMIALANRAGLLVVEVGTLPQPDQQPQPLPDEE